MDILPYVLSLCPVDAFLLSAPVEIAVYVHWLSDTRPYPPSRAYLPLCGTLEQRIERAGTSSPTVEEADTLHGYGIWSLFAAQNDVLFAITIPPWDVPAITSSRAIKSTCDSVSGYFSIGDTDFTDRNEHPEGTGQVDANVMKNIHQTSLTAIRGKKVKFAMIPNDVYGEEMDNAYCDFIFLDLEATHTLLEDRFRVMNLDAIALARDWTCKSFLAISQYVTSISQNKLPLLLYLSMNAAAVADECNWMFNLWETPEYLTEGLKREIEEKCARMTTEITKGIDYLL